MSRILLHPVDPRFGVSIRLLVGQFCTVGSSPAADHCLRATGIEAMHCRIGCRLNGGFLECVSDESTVLVNGVPRTRARLSNGDKIKIGIVELNVDMPERAVKRSFSVSFEDEETKDGFATMAGEVLATKADESTEFDPDDDLFRQGVERTETEKKIAPDDFEAGVEHEAENDIDTVDIYDSEKDLGLTGSEPSIELSAPEHEFHSSQEKEKNPKIGNSSQKAVFQFDSVDAQDTELTDEDLAAVENRDESMTVESADFFSPELAFTDVTNESNEIDTDPVSNIMSILEPGDSGVRIQGGSSQAGKFWKWVGDRVNPTLEVLEQGEDELVCYFVEEPLELTKCSFAEVRESVASRGENSIYLVTNRDPIEVMRFLVSKRWNERMRHPEALGMSISILPARHISALFEQIDAVVLVQKSEVCLIRIDGG